METPLFDYNKGFKRLLFINISQNLIIKN